MNKICQTELLRNLCVSTLLVCVGMAGAGKGWAQDTNRGQAVPAETTASAAAAQKSKLAGEERGAQVPVEEQRAFDKTDSPTKSGVAPNGKDKAMAIHSGTLPAGEQRTFDKAGAPEKSSAMSAGEGKAMAVHSGTLPSSEQRAFDKASAPEKSGAASAGKDKAMSVHSGTLPAGEQRNFDKNVPQN